MMRNSNTREGKIASGPPRTKERSDALGWNMDTKLLTSWLGYALWKNLLIVKTIVKFIWRALYRMPPWVLPIVCAIGIASVVWLRSLLLYTNWGWFALKLVIFILNKTVERYLPG